MTLSDFIDRAELVYGERVAVVDEPEPPGGSLGTITYAQLAEMSRSLAAALDEAGVGEGERVAIVSPNAARFLISLFGVSAYGRVLVPVNFRLNAEEIGYIFRHSGATVALIDPELDEPLRDLEVQHRFVLGKATDANLFGRQGAAPRHRVTDEQATVSINYTSGTTARPKGVELTHRNCWLNAVTFGWHAGVTDRDVYLHTLAMFHCNGWGMPYGLTAMGVRQVVLRKIDGEEILKRIEQEGVTIFNCAPAVVNLVLDAASARTRAGQPLPRPGQVRVVVAGAPPPSKVIERVETELAWEFIQIYGLTETSPLLTVNRRRSEWDRLDAAERSKRLSRAGVPAIGVRIKVDDDGEILARSNNVFAGYWQHPEETAKALAEGWFRTGDGGYTEGPYLVIADRKKGVIITGGENVSSIEVEDCLYQHPAVAEAAVVGVPDEKWGETVKALVVLSSRPDAEREGADRLYPQQVGAFQVPDLDRDPRGVAADRHRQAAEVQAAGAVLGRQDTSRELRAFHRAETIAGHLQEEGLAICAPASLSRAQSRVDRESPVGELRRGRRDTPRRNHTGRPGPHLHPPRVDGRRQSHPHNGPHQRLPIAESPKGAIGFDPVPRGHPDVLEEPRGEVLGQEANPTRIGLPGRQVDGNPAELIVGPPEGPGVDPGAEQQGRRVRPVVLPVEPVQHRRPGHLGDHRHHGVVEQPPRLEGRREDVEPGKQGLVELGLLAV